MDRTFVHDLNNILTVLRGNISLLKFYNEKEEYNNFTRLIGTIEMQMTKVEQFIETYTCKYREKNNGNREYTRIDSFIEEFLFYKELICSLKENIHIDIIIKQNSYFRISSFCLYRIVINIVKNSVEAIDGNAGEIKIIFDVETVKNKYCSTCKQPIKGTYGTCTIENTGREIDNIESIFKENYTTKGNGRGLGLYIVKYLTHENSGHILVENKNPGVRFKLYFPYENNGDICSCEK